MWARFAPLGALWAVGCGAGAGAPWRSWGPQAGHALEERLMAGITDGLLPAREHRSHVADALALRQAQEGLEALAQWQSTAGIALLQTTLEWLAGEGAQV